MTRFQIMTIPNTGTRRKTLLRLLLWTSSQPRILRLIIMPNLRASRAPSNASPERWRRKWGIKYVQLEDPQDLHDLLPVPMIIEIRPDPMETEAFWKDWQKPVIRPR